MKGLYPYRSTGIRWPVLTFMGAAILYAYPYWIYRQWDLPAHLDSLVKMTRGELILPHFLFHLSTWVAHKLTTLSLPAAGIVIEILSQGLAAVFAFKILARKIDDPKVAVFLALLCLVLGPISIFTYPKLYLGYAGLNVAHNPTVSALKPVALATVYFLDRYFDSWRLGKREMAVAVCLFLVGLLAKPSFHESLVLIVTVVVGWRALSRRVPYAHVVFWSALSAIVLAALVVQASVTFSPANGIGLCFACVYAHYAGSYPAAALFVGLSAAVPILGARMLLRQSPVLGAVVLLHIAGTMFVSLAVVEAGPRFAAGNFLWHPQLPLVVGNLLVIRALWMSPEGRWLWALVALQALSGLFFLYGLQHVPGLGFLDLFSLPPDLRVTF